MANSLHYRQFIARFLCSFCLLSPIKVIAANAVQDAQIVWAKPTDQAAGLCSMSAGEAWALTIDNPTGSGTEVIIREMETGAIRYSFHFESPDHQIIQNVVFGEDSLTVQFAVTGLRTWIYTLESSTGKIIDSAIISLNCTAIEPFRDRKRWVLSRPDGLYVCNVSTGSVDTVYTMSITKDSIGNIDGASWIGISEDESQFYTWGGPSTGDKPVRLCAWDVKTRKQIYQMDNNKTFGWRPMKNPQSNFIALIRNMTSSSSEPQGYLFDLRTGKEVRSLPNIGGLGRGYEEMSLTKDGRYLGYQSNDSTGHPIRFTDTETGKIIGQYMPKYSVRVIQFLSGPTLDVYIPAPDYTCVRLRVDPTTDVAPDAPVKPLQCSVLPNPSDGGAVVRITLAFASSVNLSLVATNGRVIQDNNLGMLDAGVNSVPIRASAGHYQCTVSAGDNRISFPIIIR